MHNQLCHLDAATTPGRSTPRSAAQLLGRVAAVGLLDLAGLGHLRQLGRQAVALEVEALGDIARGAVGVLVEVLDDPRGRVALTAARGLAAAARAAGGRAAA